MKTKPWFGTVLFLALAFPLSVVAQLRHGEPDGFERNDPAAREKANLQREKQVCPAGLAGETVLFGEKRLQVKCYFDLDDDLFKAERESSARGIASAIAQVLDDLSAAKMSDTVLDSLDALVIVVTEDECGYEIYEDSATGALSLHRKIMLPEIHPAATLEKLFQRAERSIQARKELAELQRHLDETYRSAGKKRRGKLDDL